MPNPNSAKGVTIMVEVSPGELIDKITILEIKAGRIVDPAKLRNVRYELDLLSGIRERAFAPSLELARLTSELKEINQALWQISFSSTKRGDRYADCRIRTGFALDRHISYATGDGKWSSEKPRL